MYLNGRGVAQDAKEAAAWFLKAAKSGEKLSQCNLGALYDQGLGVPQDSGQALKCFWQRPIREMRLPNITSESNTCSARNRADLAQAKTSLERSAQQGYAAAQYKLGWLYSSSESTSQDFDKAAHWFRLAAEQGEPIALYALGVMTANGQSVPRSVAAFALFTAAAEAGYRAALEARSQLEVAMTADQIRRGQEIAKSWKPR